MKLDREVPASMTKKKTGTPVVSRVPIARRYMERMLRRAGTSCSNGPASWVEFTVISDRVPCALGLEPAAVPPLHDLGLLLFRQPAHGVVVGVGGGAVPEHMPTVVEHSEHGAFLKVVHRHQVEAQGLDVLEPHERDPVDRLHVPEHLPAREGLGDLLALLHGPERQDESHLGTKLDGLDAPL